MDAKRSDLGVKKAIRTFLVTNLDDTIFPYRYVVICEKNVTIFRLSERDARNEMFKGVAIPSPLAERLLTH